MIHVILFSTVNPLMYPTAASYVLIVVIVSLALFLPYKRMHHNMIDLTLFSALLHSYLMMNYYRVGMFVYPVETYRFRKVLFNGTGFASLAVLLLYALIILAKMILPWRVIKVLLLYVVSFIKKTASE